MTQRLLLVDYENVSRVDLSILDDTYRAIVFVGATQNPPKAASKASTAHRFRRVEFQKITGTGKNALDFHIAFHLGRMFEIDTETHYVIVSGDTGFDPLLSHLNANGMSCRRVKNFEEIKASFEVQPTEIICPNCGSSDGIELHGGRWCSHCGRYAIPPDPQLLPSNRPGYREPEHGFHRHEQHPLVCACCHQPEDMSDGIYDDGEWMCGGCVAQYAR